MSEKYEGVDAHQAGLVIEVMGAKLKFQPKIQGRRQHSF